LNLKCNRQREFARITQASAGVLSWDVRDRVKNGRSGLGILMEGWKWQLATVSGIIKSIIDKDYLNTLNYKKEVRDE
jgi:hypothetical protein